MFVLITLSSMSDDIKLLSSVGSCFALSLFFSFFETDKRTIAVSQTFTASCTSTMRIVCVAFTCWIEQLHAFMFSLFL